MATTKNHRNVRAATTTAEEFLEHPKEMTRDFVEYITDYAKENPGHAALACLGVGFVLGWKLKPW